MAKVLGQIAERLKTDLGELARATVDPSFSRLRDLSNFENDKHERNRQEALADAKVLQAQKRAYETEKTRTAMHIKLFEEGFDEMRSSGNRGPLIRMMNQPGFSPIAREFGGRALNARLGQGMEGVERDAKLEENAARLRNDDARLLLSQNAALTSDQRYQQEFLYKKGKDDYNQAIDMANKNQSFINKQAYIDHMRSTKGIFNENEMLGFETIAANSDEATTKTEWTRLWNIANTRLLERGKTARSNAEIAGRIPASLTSGDIAEAVVTLTPELDRFVEQNPKLEDFLDEAADEYWFGLDEKIIKNNRKAVIVTAARIAKTFGRTATDAADPFMGDAMKLSILTGRDEVDGQPTINPVKTQAIAKEVRKMQLQDSRISLSVFVRNLEANLKKNPDADPDEVVQGTLAEMKKAVGIQ